MESNKSVLNFIDFHTLCNADIPQRKCLLSPWLLERSINMIFAPRGLGKTYLGLSVAHAVATGGNFLKYKAPCPRKVAYIDGEMPLSEMQSRIRKISNSGVPPEKDFFLISNPELQNSLLNISDSEKSPMIIDKIIKSGAELVVIELKKKGIIQADIARQIGLSESQVSRIVKNAREKGYA